MKYLITLSVSQTFDDIEFDHEPTEEEILNELASCFIDNVVEYADINIECEPIED